MFLQVKRNKKDKEIDSATRSKDLSDRLDQDIIVHNMPNKSFLSSSTYSPETNRPGGPDGENKHKKIGMFIIGGGLIAVIVLVYLAYVYVIKPVASPKASPIVNQNTVANNNQVEAVIPAPVSSTPVTNVNEASIPLSTSTTVATSSASSTIIFPGDEKIIKTAPQVIVDSDSDGLNDLEEAILGTDPKLVDSDGDTFNDLDELTLGYNPAGLGKLSDNKNLAKYSVASYEILYPITWTLKPLTTDNAVIFSAPDESFIQLSVQKNIDKQDIISWYKKEFVVSDIPSTQLIVNPSLGAGIISDDGLTAYFTDSAQANIYVLAYTPLDDTKLAYPNIFKLMINSLTLKK